MSPGSIEWYEDHRLEIPPVVLPEHLWLVNIDHSLKSAAQRMSELSALRRQEPLKIINRKWD